MAPELELLSQALQRLDQQYLLRDQQIDAALTALAGRVEQLTKQTVNLSNQVNTLAVQLSRFQAGLTK